MTRFLTTLTLALALFAGPADARPMKVWKPAELFEKAELVIVAKITELTSTGKKSTIHLGGGNVPQPVTEFSAKVQPIAIIKGEDIPKELTVTYSNIDYDQLDPPVLVNGPHRISLIKDKLFLLYLKKQDAHTYVGALDGDFDDGPAVKLLNPDPRPQPPTQ
jgi:hypothetical protein